MSLPSDSKKRKDIPLASGLLDYFPDALAAVAEVSRIGNEQHNPGEPLHWAREKSTDHADCILRHLIERGRPDDDGVSHTAKVAWRALALLQTEIEEQRRPATEALKEQREERMNVIIKDDPGDRVGTLGYGPIPPGTVIRVTDPKAPPPTLADLMGMARALDGPRYDELALEGKRIAAEMLREDNASRPRFSCKDDCGGGGKHRHGPPAPEDKLPLLSDKPPGRTVAQLHHCYDGPTNIQKGGN